MSWSGRKLMRGLQVLGEKVFGLCGQSAGSTIGEPNMTDHQLPDFDTWAHIFAILCFAAVAAWVVKAWIGE